MTKKLVCADRSGTSESFERADWSGPQTKKIGKRGPWIPDSAYGAGNSNYYNGNYDEMYGRKRRSADYWDYDYKLYDFDYEPGCSLSYQQTQFNTNLKDRLAQMMDPKSNKHIIILSEQKFENGSSKYTLDQYQEALFKRLKEKFESKYSIFLIQSLFDPGPDFLTVFLQSSSLDKRLKIQLKF